MQRDNLSRPLEEYQNHEDDIEFLEKLQSEIIKKDAGKDTDFCLPDPGLGYIAEELDERLNETREAKEQAKEEMRGFYTEIERDLRQLRTGEINEEDIRKKYGKDTESLRVVRDFYEDGLEVPTDGDRTYFENTLLGHSAEKQLETVEDAIDDYRGEKETLKNWRDDYEQGKIPEDRMAEKITEYFQKKEHLEDLMEELDRSEMSPKDQKQEIIDTRKEHIETQIKELQGDRIRVEIQGNLG